MNIKSLLLSLGLCGVWGLQIFAYQPQVWNGYSMVTEDTLVSFVNQVLNEDQIKNVKKCKKIGLQIKQDAARVYANRLKNMYASIDTVSFELVKPGARNGLSDTLALFLDLFQQDIFDEVILFEELHHFYQQEKTKYAICDLPEFYSNLASALSKNSLQELHDLEGDLRLF